MQDQAWIDGSSLCQQGSYDTLSHVCDIDSSHPSATYFRSADLSSCTTGYPKCICEGSCGPFTFETNGYAPLKSYFTSQGVIIATIFTTLTSSYICLFFVALSAIVVLLFQRNTLQVLHVRTIKQEQELVFEIQSLRRKLTSQERQMKLQRGLLL